MAESWDYRFCIQLNNKDVLSARDRDCGADVILESRRDLPHIRLGNGPVEGFFKACNGAVDIVQFVEAE